MTVQNLYTKYLDGEISKQKFLYEVRRDSNLTMISPSNSFEDVVKILKNKSIISEKASKESKGKQEVEIIAKTIDMVNPYEYTKGMEYELNITDVPATSGDLSEENIAKAQKKVLTNLTKNPRYYTEKMCGKGEVSEEWVEVTKKEIEKIGKGKKNIMREGIHDQNITSAPHTADRVADVNTDSSPSKEKPEDKFIVKFSKKNNTYQVWRGEEIITDFNTKERADSYARFKNSFYDLEESIYKKYADKWNKTLDEVKDMVKEAIALKDKAGNIQYAKDSTEASNIEKAAKAKGVILNKTQI